MLAGGKAIRANQRQILGVRTLAREELGRLSVKRTKLAPHIQKLRETHHAVARAVALGLRNFDVAHRTGYTMERVNQLKADPSFMQLVAEYREMITEKFVESADEYMQLMTSNMVKAERMIADRLADADDEGGTPVPVRELIAIGRDAADRAGYGKKSTTVNVNVDFAAALEKAIKRSGTVVEGEGRRIPSPQQGEVAAAAVASPDGS